MTRRRRFLAVTTGSLAVLALGFIVAVASTSLPGDTETEPLLDVGFRLDLDLTPVLAWILLALAVVGGVLLALGIRQAQPRQDRKRRNILGVLIGLIIFILIFRWVRPAAEALFAESESVTDTGLDESAADGNGSPLGWLFSLLLAAVLAAALTRIGLSVRATGSPFHIEAAPVSGEVAVGSPVYPVSRSLGDDPRSRILRAYQEFEIGVASAGEPRIMTETTRRHALRAAIQLDLDGDDVNELVEHHASARYSSLEPHETEADAAERSSSRLRERMGR